MIGLIAELEGVFRREFSLGDVEGGLGGHANASGLDDPYGSGTGTGGPGNTGWGGARDYLDF